jgi:hypothetical protein
MPNSDEPRVRTSDNAYRRLESGELTLRQLRATYGHIIARQVAMALHANRRDEGPWPKLDYPPKMFIAHKWRDDGTPDPRTFQLAEALRDAGVEVIFDAWWPDYEDDDLEKFIAEIVECRCVFLMMTADYLKHTGTGGSTTRFDSTWVYDELHFLLEHYRRQLEASYHGPIVDITGLLFVERDAPPFFMTRLFDVSREDRWSSFLASFKRESVTHRLDNAERARVRKEALACIELQRRGRIDEASQGLQRLVDEFPFIGDLWTALVELTQDRDPSRAATLARLGIEVTEPWRHEHRVLRGYRFDLLRHIPGREAQAIREGVESRALMNLLPYYPLGLAQVLTEMGARYAVRNHALRARQLDPDDDTPLDELRSVMADWYEEGPTWCCDNCPAAYPDRPGSGLCVCCGAFLDSAVAATCPRCEATKVSVFLPQLRCPICQDGKLSEKPRTRG